MVFVPVLVKIAITGETGTMEQYFQNHACFCLRNPEKIIDIILIISNSQENYQKDLL